LASALRFYRGLSLFASNKHVFYPASCLFTELLNSMYCK
jgi:hypothetical protein